MQSKTWRLIESKWETTDKMDITVTILLATTVISLGLLGWVVWLLRSQQKNHELRIKLAHEVLVQHQAINEHLVEAVNYLIVKDGGQWVMYGEKGEA